ncbi:uncharacterized protein LOC127735434 [Mytilus californianus]|uniref:uncharacterized protein LOC127735434 n=1 Tax=Mytilus californianus TaxID=6549 RepID=UPI002246580F|nr:uncharacterized protein LOC127735434 [Mytilus californianus]
MNLFIFFTLFLSIVFVHGQESTTIDRERQAYICANSVLDLVFVLDSSASIWEPDFYRQIKFVENIVKQFEIGPAYTQVGAVTYGQTYWHKFHLNRFNEKKPLLKAIKRIRYRPGSYTNTGDAIKYMNEEMFTENHGDRFLSRNIAVVITDGRSQEKNKTKEMALAAQRRGIKMFAIGVGKKVSQKELQNIASDPDWEHVFEVDNYKALDSIKDTLTSRTCYELTTAGPPVTTPTPAPPVNVWDENNRRIIHTTRWNRTTITKWTEEDELLRRLEEERQLRELEEQRRLRDLEEQRRLKELEDEQRRLRELEDEQRRLRELNAEQQRLRDLEEQRRLRDLDAEQQRLRDIEEQRRLRELEAEQQRLRDLDEQRRLRALEAEQQRLRDLEDEQRRLRQLGDDQRRQKELEDQRLREQEQERNRLEAEKRRLLDLEADRLRRQEEADRLRREQEAERLRREQEAERLRREQEAERRRKLLEDEMRRRQLPFGNANRWGVNGLGLFNNGRRNGNMELTSRDKPDMTFVVPESANGVDYKKLFGRCNDKPADIYFVMDSSSSIGRQNYEKQKSFLVNLVRKFDIGSDKTRVGVIPFSNDYRVAVPLGLINDIGGLSKAIHNIPYKRGGTHTAAALKYVKNFGFASGTSRQNAAQIVIVLTDGYSRDPESTKHEAKKLHDAGINTFVIGIGDGIDMEELRSIASDPNDKHLFLVDDFNALDSIKDLLVSRACDIPANSIVVCQTAGPMDIVFMYDTLNLGKERTDSIANFIFKVVDVFDQQAFNNIMVRRYIDYCPIDTQTSLMLPRDFLSLRGEVRPGMYDILKKFMTGVQNKEYNNARPVGITFLDSKLDNVETILPYIKSISDTNLFAVVIGPEPKYNTSEMRNVLLVPSYEALDELVRLFLRHFCTTLSDVNFNTVPALL